MKHKDWARSPPTTRNISELGISDSIPLTEYIPFRACTPKRANGPIRSPIWRARCIEGYQSGEINPVHRAKLSVTKDIETTDPGLPKHCLLWIIVLCEIVASSPLLA